MRHRAPQFKSIDPRLYELGQTVLAGLVKTETEIGLTCCHLAKSRVLPEHRVRLIQIATEARDAAETITRRLNSEHRCNDLLTCEMERLGFELSKQIRTDTRTKLCGEKEQHANTRDQR